MLFAFIRNKSRKYETLLLGRKHLNLSFRRFLTDVYCSNELQIVHEFSKNPVSLINYTTKITCLITTLRNCSTNINVFIGCQLKNRQFLYESNIHPSAQVQYQCYEQLLLPTTKPNCQYNETPHFQMLLIPRRTYCSHEDQAQPYTGSQHIIYNSIYPLLKHI